MLFGSKGHHEFWLSVMVVLIVFEDRLEGDKAVLASHVYHVVDPPVHLSDSPGRMPKSLERVHEHNASTDADPDALDGLEDGVDDVRTRLKDVRPDVVEQVNEGVLAAESLDAKSKMLNGSSCSLSVN